jgi:ATP-binding cassette subfamily B protein
VWGVGVAAYIVSVTNRSSLSAVGVDAAVRFDADASTLSMFAVVQLAVYGGMQIPVGLLLDRFVHSLPDGYDTVLDEDASNVSAGEKQLITIARAFVAQPSVLILDEATSSVDTRTELLLQHAMAALRAGRTSFVIAHRLSTIRDADLILVMEHGDIVEQGTHDELIAARGAYFRLYNSQFEQAAYDVDAELAMEAEAAAATATGSVEALEEATAATGDSVSPD